MLNVKLPGAPGPGVRTFNECRRLGLDAMHPVPAAGAYRRNDDEDDDHNNALVRGLLFHVVSQ